MYIRPYYGNEDGVHLPEGYGGTMLKEETGEMPYPAAQAAASLPKVSVAPGQKAPEVKVSPREPPRAPSRSKDGETGGIFEKVSGISHLFTKGAGGIPGLGNLGNLGNLVPLLLGKKTSRPQAETGEATESSKKERFGFEDCLLIGLAALLFFGKNGDRELAVFLLLLLFF